MKAIIAILFYGAVLALALECSQSPNFVSVSSSVDFSNQLPTPIQAIVPSLRFECPSFITGGNIRAVGASNFDIQVWRPQDTTGTLYTLVWRREFRRSTRLSSVNALVNSSFSMSPGIPVRPGDVIGFHSLEPARLLYTSSLRDEIIYTGASPGPLCTFSLNDRNVQHRPSAVPLISLTHVAATNQDIQAAEQRLPSVENSCTVLTTTALDNNYSTMESASMPITSESNTRVPGGDNQLTTTSSIAPVTEESPHDRQFLSLSLLEFILVVVIVALVIIALVVVISVACYCRCLHMKRGWVVNSSNCKVKRDKRHIVMNMNPAYEAVTTSQTPTQRGQVVTVQQNLTTNVSACKTASEQQPCVPSCVVGNRQHQNLVSSNYQDAVDSPRKPFDTSNSVCHYSLHSSSNYSYCYPSLRFVNESLHLKDHHAIIQPELSIEHSATPNVENNE